MVINKYVIDSGKECIQHCPYEKIRPKMELTGDAVLKLRYLQDKFPDVEFLVYGNATKINKEVLDDFSYQLDDVIVPEQVVGIASVDNIVVTGNFNTVIHKHPGQYTGFSSADEETVNSNHDFSIVIGNNNKLKNSNGSACIKIDCGRYMKAPLEVDITIPKIKNDEFSKSVEKKIKISAIEEQDNIISKIISGAKRPQHICKKCKQQLEKTEKENEWHCPKCELIYVFKS
jgi:hypothetical protein